MPLELIILWAFLGGFDRRKDWERRRTDSCRLDHVSDCESLDCLVLGCAAGAVGASNWLDVAAAFLVASARETGQCCFSKRALERAYLDARFLTMTAV